MLIIPHFNSIFSLFSYNKRPIFIIFLLTNFSVSKFQNKKENDNLPIPFFLLTELLSVIFIVQNS
ncbi:hypothetical protein LMG9446_0963 [Lactococcus lactis subsp. lactis]|nr:hypothetical protein KF134_1356 [Lactococcus lactis subsp. lactis]KST96795.1 hypothetical protein KF196_2338 [Lactococcus lactis subsp. lactis]KST97756.1 hypothetical protein KF146_0275 [Lactococcus lactis subsp. lactis]KSU15200.1 hypothetical protein LMG9446_0963 [Lactococcus lactis subsp. lactis]